MSENDDLDAQMSEALKPSTKVEEVDLRLNKSKVELNLQNIENEDSSSNGVSLDNISDSTDDSYIDKILEEMPDIAKKKDGTLGEVPLFNIPKGRYFGASNLLLADQDIYKID